MSQPVPHPIRPHPTRPPAVNYLIPFEMAIRGREEIITDLIQRGRPYRFRVGEIADDFGMITGYCETVTAAIMFDNRPGDWCPGSSYGPDCIVKEWYTERELELRLLLRNEGRPLKDEVRLWYDRSEMVAGFCRMHGIGLIYANLIGPMTGWQPTHVQMPVGLSLQQADEIAEFLHLAGYVWFANPTTSELDVPDCRMVMAGQLRRAA